jgi:lipid-A-disaccharide synthase-like uncharacterized protein
MFDSNLSYWGIAAVGFLAQGLFGVRMAVQWIMSEKAGKLVAPSIFWVFSVLGGFTMFLYGVLRHDFSIILGQAISYGIYLWNLDKNGIWKKLNMLLQIILIAVPIICFCYLLKDFRNFFEHFFNGEVPLWLIIYGSIGQLIFSLRFVYQFFDSRRIGVSTMSLTFWIISLIGSLIVATYGLIRGDIVLLTTDSLGSIINARNVMIGIKEQKAQKN